MGWWAYNIMDGDTPLDYEADMRSIAKISEETYFNDKSNKEGWTIEIFDEYVDLLCDFCETIVEKPIAFTVLVKIAFSVGFEFNNTAKLYIISKISRVDESWKDLNKRELVIIDLIEKLINHKAGQIINLKETNIFKLLQNDIKNKSIDENQ